MKDSNTAAQVGSSGIKNEPRSVDSENTANAPDGDGVAGLVGVTVVDESMRAKLFPGSDVAPDAAAERHDGDLDEIHDVDGQKITIRQLVDHYTVLLLRGYRVTRWEHPEWGVEERLPSGKWAFGRRGTNGR